ncbi:helix-turn-helix DNA binding domain protein [Microbacterium phage SadLad]|nr:helix-turn-helix DNA binding domain protein [Microbacterium phage SadLad]
MSTSHMDMSGQILAALRRKAEAMTVGEVVDAVHRASGIRWHRSSVERALRRMVAGGMVDAVRQEAGSPRFEVTQ